MSDLTKISNSLLDIASQLHHHRAEEAVNGAGWQTERNTLMGRIEVLEQSLAAAGVVDPNSTNPMAVALYAVVIFRFGNDSHKSTYLRARGWRLSIVNSFGMWHHDTHGAWNLGTAIDIQTSKEISHLSKMLSEPDPLPKAVKPPEYVDESTTQATVQPISGLQALGLRLGAQRDEMTAAAILRAADRHRVRDSATGEILVAPVQHHPV